MLNKLSRKDIDLLNILAQTTESKNALDEYIEQHEKAVRAYKVYCESVVAEVEVDKVVKPVGTKRKFKVGDKVRVLVGDGEDASTDLEVGEITTVVGYKEDDDYWSTIFGDRVQERPVVTEKCKGDGEEYFSESALELVEEKSPNELRAEVIKKAKEFVEEKDGYGLIWLELTCVVDINFVVNAEKRTVVALLKRFLTREVHSKGIAKCNPDDVFNEHIGKAIALGRALGKDVSEFESAPQPTEPVIGHKLSNELEEGIDEVTVIEGVRMFVNNTGKFWNKYTLARGVTKIIDDTNARYKN